MKVQSERTILIWMCALIGVNQLGFGAIIPVLPLYAQSFGVSQAAIGSTVAIYGVARLVTAIPAGRLADLFGRRSALAIGGVVSTLGNLWCAWADTFLQLTAARFIAGAGAGLTLTAGMIVLADITTIARRGRIMSIYQGVFLFSVGIGPLPGGYLAETYGLEVPFLGYALASVAAAVIGWFGVAETRPSSAHTNSTAKGLYFRELRTVLAAKGFKLICAISFSNALARTGALFSIIPIIGATQLNLSATQVGFAMATGSLLGVLFVYPAGIMVDRFGRKTVIVPTSICAGLAFLLYGIATDYTWYIVAAIVWGIASSASGAAPAAYATDIAPEEAKATAMGAYRTLGDTGYVLGPILLGFIADGLGLTIAVHTASILLILTALLFAARAPETVK